MDCWLPGAATLVWRGGGQSIARTQRSLDTPRVGGPGLIAAIRFVLSARVIHTTSIPSRCRVHGLHTIDHHAQETRVVAPTSHRCPDDARSGCDRRAAARRGWFRSLRGHRIDRRAHRRRAGQLVLDRAGQPRIIAAGNACPRDPTWAAIVPFIGDYMDFAYTPTSTWTWSSGRGWYEVAPGAVAFVGWRLLLFSANRAVGSLRAWLGTAGGAWLIIGPPAGDVPRPWFDRYADGNEQRRHRTGTPLLLLRHRCRNPARGCGRAGQAFRPQRR
jgi:hypothetical protein